MKTLFKFACVYCGQHMECERRLTGCQILCPACHHKIVIPPPPGESPANRLLVASHTWGTWVPLPAIEVPTRYRACIPSYGLAQAN